MPDKLESEKLGDLLVKAGLIDELQLQAALGHQRRWGHKLGKCLVDLGFVDESELLKFLSDKFKIKAVDLNKSVITEQTFAVVQEAIAKKYGVVPVFIKEGPGNKKTIILAMSDPTNLKVVDEIQFLTGYRVEPVLATESAINKVLEHYGKTYKPEPEKKREVARPVDLRREHQKEKEPPEEVESIEVGDAELLLGGEEVEEILDLKEAEQEGIEITSDDEVKVIKDEVVMVKADKPKPKGTRVGTSTERPPMRTSFRDEFKAERIFTPSPETPPRKSEPLSPQKIEPPLTQTLESTPELSLTPPELNLGAKPEAPKAEPKAPPQPITPIEIPEPTTEEKMELAQAHEFVSWEAPEPEKLEASSPESSGLGDQETTKSASLHQEITLSQPETHMEDDFWADVEKLEFKAKPPPSRAEPEDRLPFEKPLAVPEPSPSTKKEEFLGTLEELTKEQEEKDAGIFAGLPAREMSEETDLGFKTEAPEAPGEISLEMAVQTIQELKQEIKEREFQLDELLSLMMKKEIGEITTEIYLRELSRLKSQIEKLSKK